MMNKRVELMDEEMEPVNGGDYWDTGKDTNKFSRYDVGQDVELYNSPFHVTTTKTRIYEKKFCYGSIANFTKHWWYRVSDDNARRSVWITASDIEG